MKKDNDEKIYRRLDSCLVIPPPKGKKLKAIIKFFGGEFIGAIPEVTYGSVILPVFILFPLLFMTNFGKEQATNYIAINLWIDLHRVNFDILLTYGLPSDGLLPAELVDLPLYSVGHSYFSDKLPKVCLRLLCRYNLVQCGDLMLGECHNILQQQARNRGSTLLRAAETMAPGYDPETRVSLDKFIDQLPSVFNQVAQGISEFKPTPTENQECCK
nr:hypothetical protein [Tanacetum cinerariifolium]